MDRTTLQQRYGEEQVLVMPAAQVSHLAAGLRPMFALDTLNLRFIYRYQAEQNPEWRQLIPYIILRQADRVWLTQRLATQGESRLHNLFSLGVGGHINPIDAAGSSPLIAALFRELEEELAIADWRPLNPEPVALINDLSNAVSRDHLGIVFLLDVPESISVQVREQDKMVGQWVETKVIRQQYYERLESWSQLVLELLEQ